MTREARQWPAVSPSAFEVAPIEADGDRAWDALLKSHGMARAIVPAWEELAGWTNTNHGLFDHGQLVGGFVLAAQRVPFSPVSLSRINCLLVGPDRPVEMLSALLAYIDHHAAKHRILETEVRLRIPIVDDIPGFEAHAALRAAFEGTGYSTLAKVDTTYFVRIDKSDDKLLEDCDRHTRRKIRQARRSNVTIEVSDDYALLDAFYESYLDMCHRKSVPIQPEAVVGRGLRPLLERGHAVMFVERYDDTASNMVIVDTLGVPCYVLGTRTRANVAGLVPGAGQVLHHEIMRTMRDRGFTWYDLGGCEGPVPLESHHNYGVWRFKYGFGGRFIRFIPYFRKIRGPFKKVVKLTHALRGDFV